jgi:hypothetical protein
MECQKLLIVSHYVDYFLYTNVPKEKDKSVTSYNTSPAIPKILRYMGTCGSVVG